MSLTSNLLPILVLAVVVILVIALVGIFNGLVRLRNEVKNGWAQIDVQLKRRHDLIPNLVETVKGYMEHEQETLQAVTEARTQAMDADGTQAKGLAEQVLGGVLGRLLAVAESYPDLKASGNFVGLQEELASTENQVSVARQMYNQAVMRLNTKIESIPANMVAGLFGFRAAEYFEVGDDAARETPRVDFGGDE